MTRRLTKCVLAFAILLTPGLGYAQAAENTEVAADSPAAVDADVAGADVADAEVADADDADADVADADVADADVADAAVADAEVEDADDADAEVEDADDADADDADAEVEDADTAVADVVSTDGWRTRLADASFEVTPYGMGVLNVVHNTGRGAPTAEAPVAAVLGSGYDDELRGQGSLTLSARQSRFGLRAAATWAEGARADSTIEFDLWGLNESNGAGTITQTTVRLRHAFFRIGNDRWRVLAGQHWSVITPRLPTSHGHMAVALHTASGALWNRLPQLTLEMDAPVGASTFMWRLSVARPQSGDGARNLLRTDQPDPGALSQLPYLQTRVALRTGAVELGLAGHLGQETYERATGIETEPGFRSGEVRYAETDVLTWLVSADLRATFGPMWLQGQAWAGSNVNGLFGRHGVLIDVWDADDVFSAGALSGEIRDVEGVFALGGWGELGLGLGDSGLSLVTSFGIETGDEDDVDYGQSYESWNAFGGLLYRPVSWFDVSLEYLYSRTSYRADLEYRDLPGYRVDADPLRGEAPPTRMIRGQNNSVALTTRLRF